MVWMAKIMILLLLATGALIYIREQISNLMADHYYRYMKVADNQSDFFRIFELYDYIKELNIHDDYYDRQAALMISDFIEQAGSENYKEFGLKQIKGSLEEMTRSIRFQDIYARTQVYTSLADKNNKNFFDLAEENYSILIQESPERPKHYTGYARMLAKKGEYQNALRNYDQALKYLPSLENPYLNKDHTSVVEFRRYKIRKGQANIYLAVEEYQKAEKYYRKAYDLRPSAISLYKKIADTYYKRGELDKAIHYNKKGYLLSPKDSSWPFSIALLYHKKGEAEKALMYGKQAQKLAPKDQKIKKFLKKLK